jgi:hypothetical protein
LFTPFFKSTRPRLFNAILKFCTRSSPKEGFHRLKTKARHKASASTVAPAQLHVEWDTEAVLTPLGQLPFFIDFLKAAGLFDAFVADCPLRYTSPNAPKKRDVLGTTMLVDVVWAQALCSHSGAPLR